jgi:hypothetical protein
MFEVNPQNDDMQVFAAQLQHLGFADLTTLLDNADDEDKAPDVVAQSLVELDESTASDHLRGRCA